MDLFTARPQPVFEAIIAAIWYGSGELSKDRHRLMLACGLFASYSSTTLTYIQASGMGTALELRDGIMLWSGAVLPDAGPVARGTHEQLLRILSE